MKNHVTTSFVKWHEHSLDERDRARIALHLEACEACRIYYTKMSSIFDDRSLLAVKEIKQDPFLPSRVKAIFSENRKARRHLNLTPLIRWSLAGIGAGVALMIGILTGQGLDNAQQPVRTTTNLSEYYGIISQQGSIDTWNQSIVPAQEDKQ
jgi:predicted anti-sigma-YlaC factor YlaD